MAQKPVACARDQRRKRREEDGQGEDNQRRKKEHQATLRMKADRVKGKKKYENKYLNCWEMNRKGNTERAKEHNRTQEKLQLLKKHKVANKERLSSIPRVSVIILSGIFTIFIPNQATESSTPSLHWLINISTSSTYIFLSLFLTHFLVFLPLNNFSAISCDIYIA